MKRTFADAKVLFGDKISFKTFLRWVRTSANFFEVPWLNQDTKGVCGYSQNRKFDAESLDFRRTYLFDTIRSPCSICFEPLRFLISKLRLKQFPKLFYFQNSRVLETWSFLALFSQRKVLIYFGLNFNIRNSFYFFVESPIQHFYFIRSLYRNFLEIFENCLIVIWKASCILRV